MSRASAVLGFPYETPADRGDRPATADDRFVAPQPSIQPIEIGGRLLEMGSRPAVASSAVLCGPYPQPAWVILKATGDIAYISTVSSSGTSQAFRIEVGETAPRILLPAGRRLYYVGGTVWMIVYG